MLVIRLTRFGKKKKPFYRIVVAEDSAPIKGKYIEKIGHYNPLLDPPEIFVDQEKAKKWLKQGAKPSLTVWNLFVKAGILKKKIVTKRSKKKKEKTTTAEVTEKKQTTQKETAIIEETPQAIGKTKEMKSDEKQGTADNPV
jgi:small subunit ribosomal protein S16